MSQRIPLRARDGSIRAYAIVDDEDFERLNSFRWHVGTKGYVVHSRSRRAEGKTPETIRMGRMVMDLQPGDLQQADHINGDKLDHQRSNLRVVTNAQNRQNLRAEGFKSYAGKPTSSCFRGVSFNKASGKWKAHIRIDGELKHLGVFVLEEDAGRAAAQARLETMPFSEN